MSKQTEDYIILPKPISNRFREAAKSISNEELREIVKDGLRSKVREELNCINLPLEEITETWFEDENNVECIINTLKESIENRLYGRSRWC